MILSIASAAIGAWPIRRCKPLTTPASTSARSKRRSRPFGSQTELRTAMWILTIRSAQDEPYEHILNPGRTTIGRKADNDVTIPEESASRRHAELTLNADGNSLVLRDLASTNGTFLNRERLTQPNRLSTGDEI